MGGFLLCFTDVSKYLAVLIRYHTEDDVSGCGERSIDNRSSSRFDMSHSAVAFHLTYSLRKPLKPCNPTGVCAGDMSAVICRVDACSIAKRSLAKTSAKIYRRRSLRRSTPDIAQSGTGILRRALK
jgi:hypothetical protein